MSAPKTFTIIKNRRGVDSIITATLEEHTSYFRNTLNGAKPKTASALVKALNVSIQRTMSGSFNPTSYSLAPKK